MPKEFKRTKTWTGDRTLVHALPEAIKLVKANANAKFDETVEIAVNLGVDPRHADQNVRGVVSLPSGTGRDVRVAVIAKDAKAAEATAAGADIVGAEDLVERIQGGFMEFDRVIATPDMMALVGRLGKVLGPRGLMPNPRVGTVTPKVLEASNVDLTTEFGDLILLQRGFQACSEVISVSNDMIQQLFAIRGQ